MFSGSRKHLHTAYSFDLWNTGQLSERKVKGHAVPIHWFVSAARQVGTTYSSLPNFYRLSCRTALKFKILTPKKCQSSCTSTIASQCKAFSPRTDFLKICWWDFYLWGFRHMQYIQSHLRVMSRTSFCLVSHQGFYNPWIDKTLVYNETITKHRVLGFLCLKRSFQRWALFSRQYRCWINQYSMRIKGLIANGRSF